MNTEAEPTKISDWLSQDFFKPSQLFLDAAQALGEAIQLDVNRIIAGDIMELNGLRFWISHHGQADPNGLVLLLEVGNLPPGKDPAPLLREMLEHNLCSPTLTSGYYALIPGRDAMFLCHRIDLAHTDAPAEVVLAIVSNFVQEMEASRPFIEEVVRELASMNDARSADSQAASHAHMGR